MDFNAWLEKNNYIKGYSHFDKRIAIKDVLSEIQDKQNIATHSYLPFIHYPLTFKKFPKNNKPNLKTRELFYSSHYDRCIYQYYSYLLNEKYNKLAISLGINDVAIAYRNNLNKNNIHFAKEAFDFIKSQNSCFIIVGDFKNFFDNLNHSYLKQRICEILQTKNLPDDYYSVFKNITRYSYVNLTDILKYYEMDDTPSNIHKLNQKELILPIDKLRKSKHIIQQNKNPYGIPQGSAISATISNIYMLKFDCEVTNYISSLGGKYLRYSDDSIFILPFKNNDEIIKEHSIIKEFIQNIPNLELQTAKTKIYTYSKETGIKNIDSILGVNENGTNIIDYLGFCFDGKNITIRDKTISKYFYRTYGKADTIVKQRQKGNKISCKNLYETYSLKGSNIKKYSGNTAQSTQQTGNFLTYAKRCAKIFGKKEKVSKILNTHYGKIKKRLNKQN